jgi:hypothetical protein
MIDDIKAIINPDAYIEVMNYGEIVLKETDNKAKLKKVTLRGFDAKQTFAFKLDIQGKRISEYFNPAHDKINKGCDGIIFTRITTQWYVFICKLKSGKPQENEYLLQFRNTRVFVKFINAILEEFYNLTVNLEVKCIIFDKMQKNRLNKTETKGKKIEPEVISTDNINLTIYKIHHLGEQEFFNIRHLKLN